MIEREKQFLTYTQTHPQMSAIKNWPFFSLLVLLAQVKKQPFATIVFYKSQQVFPIFSQSLSVKVQKGKLVTLLPDSWIKMWNSI